MNEGVLLSLKKNTYFHMFICKTLLSYGENNGYFLRDISKITKLLIIENKLHIKR